MACERPLILKNPKGGTLRAICGTCRSCMIQDIKDWTLRLEIENKRALNAYFITLTYAPEFDDGELHKEHFQTFIKNLRNSLYYKSDDWNETNCRYFGCGEYGPKTLRPHYHLLLFNIPLNKVAECKNEISKAWSKGFVSIDKVNTKTIHYVCKYIFKAKTQKHLTPRPFRLMSLRPAIGASYLDTHADYHLEGKVFYSNLHGEKKHLPRYYSSKIFDDEYQELMKENAKAFASSKALTGTAQENVMATTKRIKQELQANQTFYEQNKNQVL